MPSSGNGSVLFERSRVVVERSGIRDEASVGCLMRKRLNTSSTSKELGN